MDPSRPSVLVPRRRDWAKASCVPRQLDVSKANAFVKDGAHMWWSDHSCALPGLSGISEKDVGDDLENTSRA